MRGELTVSLAAMVLAALTGVAAGLPSTNFVPVGTQNIGGTDYNIWEVQVTVTSDWTATRLNIDLDTGSLYQDPNGGNTKPTPAEILLHPDLAYDTYVTTPNDGPVTFGGNPTIDGTSLIATWGDQVDTGVGTWTVAQLALTTDAQGPIGGYSYQSTVDNQAPTADANGPYVLDLDVTTQLTLDGTGSTDPDGDIFSYMWDLDNNGSYETDVVDHPEVTVDYADLQALGLTVGGTYDLVLQATDCEWLADTATTTLTIIPEPGTLSLLAVLGLPVLRRKR